ncbi:helix-turn-helix domain-containing protein [Cellulosilyticum sp. WCF-2]|uniref:helix-turn-helix domain-containing protein n=1 Tax=Cellulosilyticum sp. WCF-2 TaxID=2497860 RepID=UPI000F8F4004|nr:helix-turn-helix domain-containing protein [Cellulosilyticum sp. WCF-2]QEH68687.1 helix-turn-helix domain-containing protein [Cellulosilyticum sp. WCF-2]
MSIEETIKESVKVAIVEALKEFQVKGGCDEFPEIMNVKQTAKFLNVGTTFVYENIAAIPHFQLGGSYRFIKSELMKYCLDKTGRSFKVVRSKSK